MTISSSASSIRTSISTRGSFSARIGIPLNMFTVMFAIGRDPRLDRALVRAVPRSRTAASAVPGRSTPGRRAARTSRWPGVAPMDFRPSEGRFSRRQPYDVRRMAAVKRERPLPRPWVEPMVMWCRPDAVVWCVGSRRGNDRHCQLLVQ